MSYLDSDPEMLELLGESRANPPASGEVLPPGAGGPSAMVGGAFDAASRFDREVALWSPAIRSADSDLLPEKSTIDARVRDTVRNDAFAAAGSEIRKDNIVGALFAVNSKPDYTTLGLDKVWAEEFQTEVEAKFTLWAESPRNWVDASRINNFTSLVRLAVGMSVLSGEVLAAAEWIRDGRMFNTAIQMVDTDRLSTPPNLRANRNIRGGVERDAHGAPQAYHIRMSHPTDFFNPDAYRWKRVPTEKPWGRQQIIHLFQQFRPDQSRGVARMVAGLKESRITKKFRDVVLQNAVVNATYAASIESDMPSEVIFQSLGGGQMDSDTIATAVQNYAGGYMSVIADYIKSSKSLQIDGVKIPHLLPGTKLQLRPASQNGPLGTEFEQSLLRYLAAILGVSYEQLSKDYSQTNYSSARAAMTETWKTMQSDKKMFADRFASAIFLLWLEEAFSKGEITALPRKAPNFWEGLNREAYGACEWIGASRGQIDELKETQAAVLRIKYRLSTYEDEHARLGKDFRRVFEQVEREVKIMENKGIAVAEGNDNMMNATTGAPRESEAKDEKDDGSENNTDA